MENNEVVSAEEFLKQFQKGGDSFCVTKGEAVNKLIEFAKMHVRACKKDIAKNALINYGVKYDNDDNEIVLLGNPVFGDEYKYVHFDSLPTMRVHEQSILDAYPETNIK